MGEGQPTVLDGFILAEGQIMEDPDQGQPQIPGPLQLRGLTAKPL